MGYLHFYRVNIPLEGRKNYISQIHANRTHTLSNKTMGAKITLAIPPNRVISTQLGRVATKKKYISTHVNFRFLCCLLLF